MLFRSVVKQFAKVGVQLEVRATDGNQFQDKVRKGKHQVFWMGWLADYPDAENFLFQLYGPNSKSISDGENTANYANPEFDRLFRQLKSADDGPRKQALIDQMVHIVQEDAPWSFGYFPYTSAAEQRWVRNSKATILIKDRGRVLRVDTQARVAALKEWNRPVMWPLLVLLLLAVGGGWMLRRSFKRRERMNARGEIMA